MPLGTPYWATYIDDDENFQQHPVAAVVIEDRCAMIGNETSFFLTSNDCSEHHSPLCEEITDTVVRGKRNAVAEYDQSPAGTAVTGNRNGWSREYHYTTPTGEFHSRFYPWGEYDNYWSALYTITVDEGNVITLTSVTFHTQYNADFVTIRDGGSSSSPVLDTLSGQHFEEYLVKSSSNTLYITFTTDSEYTAPGFSFIWTSEWDGTWDGDCTLDYNTATGYVYSPLYPIHYPKDLNCHWTINVDEGSLITLTLVSFDTEANTDILHIRDGASSSSPLLSTLSGHVETGYAITSSSNALYIDFSTGSSVTGPGFSFVWTSQWDGTWDGDCTLDYSAESGTVISPLYPTHYPMNQNCQWTITANEGSVITLTVVSFETQKDEDIVQIRDGGLSSSSLLDTLSGSIERYSATSTSNKLFISFTTDDENTAPGFSFTWTSKSLCPTPYMNVGGMCLTFQFNALTFGQAGIACNENMGQLASINDIRNLRDLYTYFNSNGIGDTSFWLGGSDSSEEGVWKWKDGTLVPTGTPYWGTGGHNSEVQEPDGGDAENCLLLASSGFFYFRDAPCSEHAAALCLYMPE